MLTNRGQLRWINDWIVQWRMHRYHQWWQLIAIWVTFLAIKELVITRSVLWRTGWLLTKRGQLRWIDDLIIQWRRQRYHPWWKLIALWVTVLVIKSMIIKKSCSLPTLIFPCFTFVATNNTLWTWHNEWNMSLREFCVPVILFVYVQQKARANFLAQ